jgi:hypothetical protein
MIGRGWIVNNKISPQEGERKRRGREFLLRRIFILNLFPKAFKIIFWIV